VVSFPPVSPPRPYTPLSPRPYAPHAQPISFSGCQLPYGKFCIRDFVEILPDLINVTCSYLSASGYVPVTKTDNAVMPSTPIPPSPNTIKARNFDVLFRTHIGGSVMGSWARFRSNPPPHHPLPSRGSVISRGVFKAHGELGLQLHSFIHSAIDIGQ